MKGTVMLEHGQRVSVERVCRRLWKLSIEMHSASITLELNATELLHVRGLVNDAEAMAPTNAPPSGIGGAS